MIARDGHFALRGHYLSSVATSASFTHPEPRRARRCQISSAIHGLHLERPRNSVIIASPRSASLCRIPVVIGQLRDRPTPSDPRKQWHLITLSAIQAAVLDNWSPCLTRCADAVGSPSRRLKPLGRADLRTAIVRHNRIVLDCWAAQASGTQLALIRPRTSVCHSPVLSAI